MSSHPLKRNTGSPQRPNTTNLTPPNRTSAPRYDSLTHSSNTMPSDNNMNNFSTDMDDYSQDYSDELSGGYGLNETYTDDENEDEYDDLNSEAQEYYNSGASELVTTVR